MTDLKRLRILSRYKKDPDIHQKVTLFRRALELRSVQEACQEVGKAPRYYYYWWNRFRDSGFQLKSLKKISTRPKSHPRQVPEQTARLIQEYRIKKSSGLELIPLLLEREHRIRVSRSSVYRVLKKAGLLPDRRKKTLGIFAGYPSPPPPHLPRTSGGRWPPPARGEGAVGESYRRTSKRPSIPLRETTSHDIIPTLSPPLAERFEEEKILGMGGGGIVFLAKDHRTKGTKVALKVLELQSGADPALIASMRNEFATLSSLQHPHLARVFDFGQTEREVFFSGEWIEGKNILEACRQANLNVVFGLLVQVLRALDYLHARGVLHLDLKPENILVASPAQGGDLQVKLIDFGTAEWRKKGTVFQGEFVGTPPFASPEIILEHTPTGASDVYSLGMIFYQIFCGRFPFVSQDPFEMMKEQVYGEIQSVENIHPSLPEEFRDFLRKMVEKNPAERLQTPARVLEALNQCLGENFSFRGKTAPLHILAECDTIFHKRIFEDLVDSFGKRGRQLACLAGPGRWGKSFLVRKVKEALQLTGIHPWLFEDEAALEEFLKNPQGRDPLFIDLPHDYSKDWVTLLDRLENTGLPVLLTLPFAPSPDLNPGRWVELFPLGMGEIQGFLETEILDFPADSFALPITTLCRGHPQELEKVLHAMHEEGWIQWTDRGWRWVMAEEPDFSRLLSGHEERWKRRLSQVQEILLISKVPLGAETLEGILGLDPGALEDFLNDWEKTGRILSKKIKNVRWYVAPATLDLVEPPPLIQGEAWMEKRLEDLYREGTFSSGAKLAEVFFSSQKDRKVSASLLIMAARHFVAAGMNQKALDTLPTSPPPEPSLTGLFFEIRARALLNLGKSRETLTALDQAEPHFTMAGDKIGVARIYNLRGSVQKRAKKFPEAEAAFRRATEFATQAGDAYIGGLAWMNLGALFYDLGKFDPAEEAYEKAIALEKSAAQPLLSRLLRENRLNLLFHTGKSRRAREAAYDLLKTSIRQMDRGEQAVAFNYLALLAGQENQTGRNLQFLNQALEILDPQIHLQPYFQTLSNRANTFLALRNFAAAQLDAEEALALGQRLSQTIWMGIAHLALGKVFRDRPRPDLEEATRHLNQAHQIIYENRISQILWEVEFERGRLAKRKGEKIRAKNYFHSAQRFLEAFLGTLPEALQRDFLRGRQQDRIAAELGELGN